MGSKVSYQLDALTEIDLGVKDEVEIPLRITLHRAPPGVRFAMQKGKAGAQGNAELIPPTRSDPDSLSFDFSVRVAGGSRPRFLGEFTQGPPDKRFVYVNSGQSAGQPRIVARRFH